MDKIKILKQKYNPSSQNLDLLEAKQPGLDDTSLKREGAYDEIQKESNAPSKVCHRKKYANYYYFGRLLTRLTPAVAGNIFG